VCSARWRVCGLGCVAELDTVGVLLGLEPAVVEFGDTAGHGGTQPGSAGRSRGRRQNWYETAGAGGGLARLR